MNTICPSCNAVNRLPEDRQQDDAKCGKCGHSLFDGKVIDATKENFDQLIKDDLPVIVDFWAPWCGPCRNFTPVFQAVAEERAHNLRCIKINTEQEQEIANRFRIRSIPTIMVFHQGKMVDMINGALPKPQFDQWLNDVLANIK